MFREFKEFISRGNVIDMAVGIIMGAAFTTIVKSLVDDVIMPVIGVMTRGIDFSSLFIALSDQKFTTIADAKAAGVAVISYGIFINAVIYFVLVSFAVFVLVKAVNRMRRKQAQEPENAPEPPRNEVLLAEIRDLLAAGKK